LVLWVIDVAELSAVNDSGLKDAAASRDRQTWLIVNKIDQVRSDLRPIMNEIMNSNITRDIGIIHIYELSAGQEQGFGSLVEALSKMAEVSTGNEPALITRARHRRILESTSVALQQGLSQRDHELLAEDLRTAATALGRLTGRIDVEDVLDVIFRDFCIGK
jgi:tRNA modification GTPase